MAGRLVILSLFSIHSKCLLLLLVFLVISVFYYSLLKTQKSNYNTKHSMIRNTKQDQTHQPMGCAQAKESIMDSQSKRLDKLKLENGYLGKGGFMGPRRSTGQRYMGTDPGHVNQVEPTDRIIGSSEDNVMIADGWPKWLTDNIPRDALAGLVPKSAETYEKLDKVGQGTYSNVYKAQDRETGKIVALKKVRFDTSEPQSVKFMAREILILRKLDHPNVLKLEGLATSRMQYSLYLVFEFMHSDLSRILARPEGPLTEPQVKCYMLQLLSGLQHCHGRGILHRDIKGSNLLIDKNGVLKIGDFGLANYYSPKKKRPLTSRVVTLWYRAPELLLGSTDYGTGIDLWSAGCLLAEMYAGRPILPGRTEVEQLHRIFKLCGTPSEDYWKKLKLSTTFRPPQSYKNSLIETFRDFPPSTWGLLSTLLALDPAYRGSAFSALQNELFYTSPLACEISGLPVVYDESIQADEKRFRRRKLRSRTTRQRKRKDEAATSTGTGTGSSSSNTSTGSTSSGSKLTLLLSPVDSSRLKMMPARTEDHPKGSKNVKNRPPLPSSKIRVENYNNTSDDNKGKLLSQVQRSASTREFRKSMNGSS